MPKITVKHNLIIFHRLGEWSDVYAKILQDYGMGMAIRPRLQRELGFTYRYHRGLERNDKPGANGSMYHYEDQVHLDFYNTEALTWFQLKYLNL